MQNISDKFKEQLNKGNRNYNAYVDITLSDGTVLNITNSDIWQGSFSIEDSVSGDSEFQIGSAIINKFSVSLNNIEEKFSEYDFYDSKAAVYIGMEFEDGTVEKIKKGVFNADEVKHNGELVSLTYLDNMAKFQKEYSESKLQYPSTRAAILRDACENCGVILKTVTFDGSDLVVQSRPSDEALTFQQVVAWVAQLSCKWARCDKDGQLELIWFDQENLLADVPEEKSYHNIDASHLIGAPSVEESDVEITGVKVIPTEGDSVGFYGETGYVLSVEQNDLIEESDVHTIASALGQKLVGLKFRPMDASSLSNPAIEAGDIMIVTNRKGSVYRGIITSTVFSLGNSQTLTCGAQSPGEKKSVQYSETTKNYIAIKKALRAEKTEREKAIEDLAGKLADSSGMYSTSEIQPDGSTISYLHDKPTLAESKNVIKLTSDAIGVSNDGGKTYPYGFTLDGTTITRLLYAEGINANYIDAGSIQVKDDSENVIFLVDFDTGKVVINAQSISIGGQSVATKEDVEKAKALAVTLSNEFQGVPSNSDGSDPDLTDCQTGVTVVYGSSDVTSICTFTFAKSDGVSGNWDSTKKIYTITGLTEDTGWVDITANYLGIETAAKRFSVSKAKQGLTSTGRTYFIEQSAVVISRQTDGNFSPSEVKFSAFYRDGASEQRMPYAGRFVIEETSDGSNYSTVYVSQEDETSVVNYPYSALTTEDGQSILTEDGNYIGFASKVTSFRCTLYASGGTVYQMDTASVAVVNDTTALTSDEVFDLLTGNGTVKGIYKEGDQLFISFTYAKGGVLKLGGPGNGYGILNVLDSDGNVVGAWTKDGVTLPPGTKIAWSDITGTGNVASKSDVSSAKNEVISQIPTENEITTITENTISTAVIKANQIIGNQLTLGGSTGTSMRLLDSNNRVVISLNASNAVIGGMTVAADGITLGDTTHGVYLPNAGGIGLAYDKSLSYGILQHYENSANIMLNAGGNRINIGQYQTNYCKVWCTFEDASDKRMKKDISDLESKKSYELCMNLKPVKFRWRNSNDKELHHGFIAQDSQAFSDDWGLVREDDRGYLAMSYIDLISDVVGALQYMDKNVRRIDRMLNRVWKQLYEGEGK